MKKLYRVAFTMVEEGYVEVEAESEAEARSKAPEIEEFGGFISTNSFGEVGKVLEVLEIKNK